MMWKEDLETVRERFRRFWKREGFLLSTWEARFPVDRQVHPCPDPGEAHDREVHYTDPEYVTAREARALSRCVYPGDMLPLAFCDRGTVTLAPMLGAVQNFGADTVWYTRGEEVSPENDRSLVVADDSPWLLRVEELARRGAVSAEGRYLCGLPALCGGLDVLAELRGAENLCMDLILNPDWVKAKLEEIEETARRAFDRIWRILKDPEGWSVQGYFMAWGPGKTGLNQCDFAAMISPEMFREFALPVIARSCRFLDNSIYHVDGPAALKTIDALLEIPELDCIEYTPGPKVPQGGDPEWYPWYRKIREAGKCVQVVEMQAREVVPLLDELGPDGLYMLVNFRSEKEIEEVLKAVEPYRKG